MAEKKKKRIDPLTGREIEDNRTESKGLPIAGQTLNASDAARATGVKQTNIPNEEEKIVTEPAPDIGSLAGRLAFNNVAPNQPGMTPELINQLRNEYNQQNAGRSIINPVEVQQRETLIKEIQNMTPEQIQNLSPEEQARLGLNPINVGTGLTAGLASGIGAAKIGAAIGTAIAPGVGTAVGAAAGVVTGITVSLVKISSDEKQTVNEIKKNFDGVKDNMNRIISASSLDPSYKNQALLDWEKEKANLFRIRQVLKRKTENVLDDFLGQPGDEYAEVEAYIRALPNIERSLIKNTAII